MSISITHCHYLVPLPVDQLCKCQHGDKVTVGAGRQMDDKSGSAVKSSEERRRQPERQLAHSVGHRAPPADCSAPQARSRLVRVN